MNRSQIYDTQIKVAAEKHSVPFTLLKSQVRQESDFNPAAISVCGACGLLQLMPATAKEMGLLIEQIFDVEKNLESGARYLRIQYDHFPEIKDPEERWKFALASYNGGRGNANKEIKKAIEQCGLAMFEEDPQLMAGLGILSMVSTGQLRWKSDQGLCKKDLGILPGIF